MEQGGERLKSYSTAVYFHRVHEIYFPQLAEQWKYLLSIQWRYSETRVKQHPDQHRAGANHFIINRGGKKPNNRKHWKLTHSAQKAALPWRCFISEPHLGTLWTDCANYPEESETSVWLDGFYTCGCPCLCTHTSACPHTVQSCAFHRRLPKPEPVQYILQIN